MDAVPRQPPATSLEVPGAKLHYEVVGDGPLLLCISGGDGSCENWRLFAECLKQDFKVVMWDRRGFSRSILTDTQDYDHRLETDIDDAIRLIERVAPSEPATIIGNSSGAIVALSLLANHANKVKRLVSYEPPLARVLPNFKDIWATHEEIVALYRKQGPVPAMKRFAELTKVGSLGMQISFEEPFLFSNVMYWFEREFMTYPQADIDVEGALESQKDKLLLINGEESPKDAYQYRGNIALAEKLGLEVKLVPGNHVGQATHAKDFAAKLLELLRS